MVNPPTNDDFLVMSQFGCFFYAIDAIQDYPQPFSIANLPDYVGRCYVCHTPKNANFWHFSVRWKIGKDDVEEVLTESQRKNLLGLVRSFLVEKALKNCPNATLQTVPQDWHQN